MRLIVSSQVFLIVFVGILATSCALAQPKLVLDKKEIDLGTVYNGANVKAKLKLTNAGTEKLMVLSLHTSCGCTTVREPKGELAPGESDYAEVQFNSSGFRGKATKYVHIETNDPSNQYVSIVLTADVKEELQPTNKFSLLWFGDVQVGKESHMTYALKNISSANITIKKVNKVYPKLTISFDKKTIAPSDSVIVKVSVVASDTGYFNESFTLETDSRKQPHVPIRVSFIGVTPR